AVAARGLTRLTWISGAVYRKFAVSPVCPEFSARMPLAACGVITFMRRFLPLLGLPLLAILASAAGKQPITGADVLKIRNVTSVAVASDGSFAVYGVQSIHTDSPTDPKGEPAYKYRTL